MIPIFVSHGSPMIALEENGLTKGLSGWANQNSKPDLIIAVSAHWITRRPALNLAPKHTTLHDFGGFPDKLYQVKYEPLGRPEFKSEIDRILDIELETELARGLDHGIWTVLKWLYPKAEVPVVQLSLGAELSLKQHFEIGQKLANLPDNYLLFSTGNLTHNLRDISFQPNAPFKSWARRFDEKAKQAIQEQNWHVFIDPIPYFGDDFTQAHPTIDHYLPLLYAIGAVSVQPIKRVKWLYEAIEMGTLAMRTMVWE
ncbi:MAG: 4,5-DOPA dioxygenase extradiol [Patescibacteria group bacterium]